MNELQPSRPRDRSYIMLKIGPRTKEKPMNELQPSRPGDRSYMTLKIAARRANIPKSDRGAKQLHKMIGTWYNASRA